MESYWNLLPSVTLTSFVILSRKFASSSSSPQCLCTAVVLQKMKSTWRTRGLVAGFCIFTIITTFVNKHVLSDLKFTYPTIFQSWQTGTVFLVLLSLSALGYVDINVQPSSSMLLLSWLPSSVLFSGIIYSGSVALSRLAVPVFCVLHYTSTVFVTLLDWFILKKVPSLTAQVGLIFIAIATIVMAETDAQFDPMGYMWMLTHCGFSALYVFYGKTRKKNSLSEFDKLFLDAFISFVVLMGISIATGELFTVIEFPFLYSTHFHLGCMASGIFGAVLGISKVLLSSTELSSSIEFVNGLNKAIVSLLSLLIFEIILTTNTAASIVIALSSGVLYSYTVVGNTETDLRTTHPVHDS